MSPTSPESPDRHRLDDLIRLTFDQAQASTGGRTPGVTDQQIADAGPYSLAQVREHLDTETDAYVLERDGDDVRVVEVLGT